MGRDRMNCPVCARPLAGTRCTGCGYDRSRDYEAFPSLSPLPNPTFSPRRNERTGLLLCSKCGSPDFRFRFTDRNFSCPRCGHLLTPQELDSLLSIMGCAPLHHTPAPPTPPKPKRRITAVSAGFDHTAVLYSDGTVGAIGSNLQGQCNVLGWSDIIAIAAGAYTTVGLRRDGAVVAAGEDRFFRGCSAWSGITAIAAGQHALGLQQNGSVQAVGSNKAGQCRTDHWREITAVAVGGMHSVGLKKNGTVVSAGYCGEGLTDAYRWTDINAIAAGAFVTVGLRNDGTVVAAGHSSSIPEAVRNWSGITAVSAAGDLCIGLRSDGTVLTAGHNAGGPCRLSHWSGIRAVSAGFNHIVALRSDGTLVTAGANDKGQCDVHKLLP